MRISDWSSDVCSSDLRDAHVFLDCNRELPEISLGGALPEQRSSSRLPVHLDYTYLDIERNTEKHQRRIAPAALSIAVAAAEQESEADRKSTRLNSSH